MKNRLLLLFALVFYTGFTHAQTTYYSCATPSGVNATLSNTGANPCNVAPATWNVAGNTFIVRDGSTFNITTDATINCAFIIEEGGTVNIDDATFFGSTTVNIVGSLIVNGDLNINDNLNCTFNILSGGFLEVGTTGVITNNSNNLFGTSGDIVFNTGSNAVINGSVTSTDDITVNGTVTGNGTLDAENGGIAGSGTINGTSAPWTSPLDLGNTGIFTWDGTEWTGGAVPNGVDADAVFSGNFDESVNGDFLAGSIQIGSGVNVSLNTERQDLINITNEGLLELVDEATISTTTTITGAGNVRLTRTIGPDEAYKRLGFPVSSGTWADVTASFPLNITGPANTISIYTWDAANSAFVIPTNSTPLAGTAFYVFTFSATDSKISATVPNSGLNNNDLSFSIDYNNPGADPIFVPGPTDGWNQFCNPFMDDISSQTLVEQMALTTDFQQNSVSIWDGSQYKVWSTTPTANDPDAEFIRPFEAFFVRTDVVNSGSFTIANTTRSAGATSANSVGYFKTQGVQDNLYVKLKVTGANQLVRTYVSQNDNATKFFDKGEDVAFFAPSSTVPSFYSLDRSNKAMRINKLGTVHKKTVKLGFEFGTNGGQFTISAEDFNVPNGVRIILIDKHANKRTRLDKRDYTFTHNTAAPANRFRLKFRGSTASYKTTNYLDEDSYELANAWFIDNELQLETEETIYNATVQIYNMSGQLLVNQKHEELNYLRFNLNQSGMYIVNIIQEDSERWVTKVAR